MWEILTEFDKGCIGFVPLRPITNQCITEILWYMYCLIHTYTRMHVPFDLTGDFEWYFHLFKHFVSIIWNDEEGHVKPLPFHIQFELFHQSHKTFCRNCSTPLRFGVEQLVWVSEVRKLSVCITERRRIRAEREWEQDNNNGQGLTMFKEKESRTSRYLTNIREKSIQITHTHK